PTLFRSDLHDALEVDAAARTRLRVQSRDQLHGDGDRHDCRPFPWLRADLAAAAGEEGRFFRDAFLPQCTVAGAALLLHVPVAVSGDGPRRDDTDSGLDEGDAGSRAARDG